MKRKLRTLISWLLVSLMLQFTFYYFLNNQVEKVMAPTENKPIVVQNLEAEIPGTSLEDIQLSYAKDYLAYKENGVLKVFNLKQGKVVFEKKPQAGSDKNMGVLYYQWLPDRDTLVYFFGRKNPNPVTEVVVPVTPAETQKNTSGTPAQSASNTNTQKSANSSTNNTTNSTNLKQTAPASAGVKTQSETTTLKALTASSNVPASTPTTKNQEPEKVEDPNQTPNPPATQKPETKPQTRIEKRYNNPQITELFTLELPPSDEEGTSPDDRLNRSIDSFPAGGEITQMVVSTFTNLMYLTIKNGTNLQLMEIDIMKNVRTLNRSGEVISQMAASDKFGTLYVKSKSGKTEQILALQGFERETISNDANDVILGDRAGTLYLGKVQENRLVNIRIASDTKDEKNLDIKTIWEGSIPYKNPKGVIIGAKNEVIIYDDKNAYIVEEGKEKPISLSGEENYISSDGVELVQLTRIGMSTKVKLQPLQ